MFHTKFRYENKRSQRALGPSPEEKVKCHSGAIYRGPLVLYTKYQGSRIFFQEDFQVFITLEPFQQFWQGTRVWSNFNGLREKVV